MDSITHSENESFLLLLANANTVCASLCTPFTASCSCNSPHLTLALVILLASCVGLSLFETFLTPIRHETVLIY